MISDFDRFSKRRSAVWGVKLKTGKAPLHCGTFILYNTIFSSALIEISVFGNRKSGKILKKLPFFNQDALSFEDPAKRQQNANMNARTRYDGLMIRR